MKKLKKFLTLMLAFAFIMIFAPAKSAFAADIPAKGSITDTIAYSKLYTVSYDGNKYYNLKVTKSGVVTINIADKGSETWFSAGDTYYIYDQAGNKYLEGYVDSKDSKIYSTSLCAGDYILCIETPREGHHIAAQFTVNYAAAKESFADSLINKHDDTVSPAILKTSVDGFMATLDTKDVYKFTLKADKKVTLKFATLEIPEAYMKVFKSNGDDIVEYTDLKTGSNNRSIILKKGVYYIQIESYDSACGQYTLSAKTSAVPSVKLKSLKNDKNNKYYSAKTINVKWSKRAEASAYQIRYSVKANFKKSKIDTIENYYTTAAIKELKAKKVYYVKVRAVYKVGEANVYSKWSNVKKIRTSK